MNNIIYIFSAVIIFLLILLVFFLLKMRKLSYLNNLISQLNNDLESKNKEISNLNADIENKSLDIANLNSSLESKNKEISNLNADIENKSLDIANLNSSLESKNKEIINLNADIENKSLDIANLNSNLESKNKEISNLNADIENKSLDIANLNANLESKNKEINDLNEELENKKKSIHQLNEDLEDLENEKNKYKKNVKELNNKISELDIEKQSFDEKLKKAERELDDTKDELTEEKKEKESIGNIFKSVLSILNSKSEENKYLNEFRKIIADPNYKNMGLLFYELKDIENELDEIVKNPILYTRNIVSIGGAFSSGKSSFINTLFSNGNYFTLPTGDVPVTSIPAYIIHSEESYIECLTLDNKKSKVDKSIFDFISVKNSVSENIETTFNPKNVIKYFYINDKLKVSVRNICFVDTPGYNPPNESKEDREISKKHIANTNTLIWLINVTEGTITKTDIQFLKEILAINPKIKMFIIINRSDTRDDKQIKEICNQVDKELQKHKISVVGISPYTSHYKKLESNEHYYHNFKYGMSLPNFLKDLNKKNNDKYESIKNNIDNIFFNYRENFKSEIEILNNYKKELLSVNNKYISNMSYVKSLVSKYRGLVPYERLKNDNGIDMHIRENTKDINENINNIRKNVENKIKEYELYINNSNKIYYDLIKCVNNIFSIKK